MKTTTKLIAVTAVLTLLCGGSSLLATEKIGKETDIRCTACHDKPGSKLLTDKGLYFETQRTLEGYEALSASFGKCTSCHARKPGSEKLTAEGKKMAALVSDMSELKDWLDERHPKPSEENSGE